MLVLALMRTHENGKRGRRVCCAGRRGLLWGRLVATGLPLLVVVVVLLLLLLYGTEY